MNIQPPVNKFSEPEELRDWQRELERLVQDPALQDDDHQERLQGHLNDVHTWLAWDLHRKVVEEGRELTEVLQEVGAHRREPGDPPPEPAADAG